MWWPTSLTGLGKGEDGAKWRRICCYWPLLIHLHTCYTRWVQFRWWQQMIRDPVPSAGTLCMVQATKYTQYQLNNMTPYQANMLPKVRWGIWRKMTVPVEQALRLFCFKFLEKVTLQKESPQNTLSKNISMFLCVHLLDCIQVLQTCWGFGA